MGISNARTLRLVLAVLLVMALWVAPALAAYDTESVYYYVGDFNAKQSAPVLKRTWVEWRYFLRYDSTGNCYFDLKYGSTEACTAVKKSVLVNPDTEMLYTRFTHSSASYWRAQINTPYLNSGRVGNSSVRNY